MNKPAQDPSTGVSAKFVNDAGVVMLYPYLPLLFNRAGLTEENRFVTEENRYRAVHILYYAVHGNDYPGGHDPVLLRLLCHAVESIAEAPAGKITEREKGMTEDMLRHVISGWKQVGDMSVNGLREAFLQRSGRLLNHQGLSKLEVKHRSFDIMLDFYPVSFSMVKLPWMPDPLQVYWR